MTCPHCGQKQRCCGTKDNSCCPTHYREYQRSYYRRNRELIASWRRARYVPRQRQHWYHKHPAWTPEMVQRWRTALQGADGWKRLRDLLNMNHEKARKRDDNNRPEHGTEAKNLGMVQNLPAHKTFSRARQFA